MTYASRLLDYLWSVAPGGATNSEIAERLGIASHQTVYTVTQDLLRRKLLHAERRGHTWIFHAMDDETDVAPDLVPRQHVLGTSAGSERLSPRTFEALARRVMSQHYGAPLETGPVRGVRKKFDLVSPDRQIVGDAKYYTLVRGTALPPAKFAVIAEHVWLLEKTEARTTFLVFGNDRDVPKLWLERYGDLARRVDFFYLSDDGNLEVLNSGFDPPPRQ